MLKIIFLVFSILSNNEINKALNIIENDYEKLVYYYQHPYLIKNEESFIKELKNFKYVNKKSEPVYLKILLEAYSLLKNNKEIENLKSKYGIINNFNIYKYGNIELFDELPINYIKNNYKNKLIKNKSIKKLKHNFYILETYCKFNHNHSIYFYNDLTDTSYINDKKIRGNSFIIENNNKNKYFKLSLKLQHKKTGLIYLKGATCSPKEENNIILPPLKTKKLNTEITIKNEEINLPMSKEDIQDLIKEDTELNNYTLYNYFLINGFPNEAYKYLIKWTNKCNNYYSQKEQYDFNSEYLPYNNNNNNIKTHGRASQSEEKKARASQSEEKKARASQSEEKKARASQSEEKKARASQSEEKKARASQSEEQKARASQSEEQKARASQSEEKKARASQTIFNNIPKIELPNIEKNKIIQKNVFIKKEKENYYQYVHYLIAVKNATKFLEYFKISSDINILGVYSIVNNKRTPIATKFTENEIFLKEVENNMYIEIYFKIKSDKIIFLKEKYLEIESFTIKFDEGIEYKTINFNNYKKPLFSIQNINPYFNSPNQANLLDFTPYYIIDDIQRVPIELKWYYFYKNLSSLEIPNSMNSINDVKKAYYFLSSYKNDINSISQNIKNKALVFYNWSKSQKINTKLLIFHLKNDIYGNKLFNYPIIQYKDIYIDLNVSNLRFGFLPKYLEGKEYITIDSNGAYLYKNKEKILKKFIPNNKVKINYKILENLDYSEFEIDIVLNDLYSNGIRSILKGYDNEEIIAKILELYINTKIKNSTLIDYEITPSDLTLKNKDSLIHIYIKGINKTPLDYFEVENKEFLKIKNYFSELFSPFFIQSPKIIEYIYNKKIINPIEIKTPYQEDLELSIELLDQDYVFRSPIQSSPNKIIIKDSFYLPNQIVSISNYDEFHKKISNYTSFRKTIFNNIIIEKKDAK